MYTYSSESFGASRLRTHEPFLLGLLVQTIETLMLLASLELLSCVIFSFLCGVLLLFGGLSGS